MATVSTHINAAPHEVFALLGNAWRYAEWVVGAKRIRKVDEHWPEKGSRFHHTVGMGPLTFHDTTEVLESEPDRRLVIEVRVWPTGRGRVTFELQPTPSGTRLVMDEVPTEGLAKKIDSPVVEGLVWLRNTETLRRMKRSLHETRMAEDE
jgi:uncharacterized protein YndB with AHSA1/START domain